MNPLEKRKVMLVIAAACLLAGWLFSLSPLFVSSDPYTGYPTYASDYHKALIPLHVMFFVAGAVLSLLCVFVIGPDSVTKSNIQLLGVVLMLLCIVSLLLSVFLHSSTPSLPPG